MTDVPMVRGGVKYFESIGNGQRWGGRGVCTDTQLRMTNPSEEMLEQFPELARMKSILFEWSFPGVQFSHVLHVCL
jgi:hypothetical protein